MRIGLRVDTSGLKARTAREIKRLAYNTALALNETAKAVQLAERANLDRKFTLRKTGFIYRLIKIFKFASARQGRPWVEIGIDPTKKRVLLGMFEKGGEKQPFKGKSVAVPVTGGPARPTFTQSVSAQYWFSRLRLRGHTTSTGKVQFKGAQRSFMLSPAGGKLKFAGIFQRGGPLKTARRAKARFKGLLSQTAVKLGYLFVPRPKLDARLDFGLIGGKTAAKEWPIQFSKAYRIK